MIFAFDERTIGSGSAVGRHHGRLIRESTIRSFGPRTNKVHNLADRRLPLKSYVTTGARCRPGLFCWDFIPRAGMGRGYTRSRGERGA